MRNIKFKKTRKKTRAELKNKEKIKNDKNKHSINII